jgi:hypothetical protein
VPVVEDDDGGDCRDVKVEAKAGEKDEDSEVIDE